MAAVLFSAMSMPMRFLAVESVRVEAALPLGGTWRSRAHLALVVQQLQTGPYVLLIA